jgi:hypothetical protein
MTLQIVVQVSVGDKTNGSKKSDPPYGLIPPERSTDAGDLPDVSDSPLPPRWRMTPSEKIARPTG